MNDFHLDEDERDDELIGFEDLAEAEQVDALPAHLLIRDRMPLYQTLLMDTVDGDAVLEPFAEHVVGNLSEYFALKAAKGGAFFKAREAEGMKNTARFQHDQNLRAHLVNGILPVIRIVRKLVSWDAPNFADWDAPTHERLLIAGYMLHDYTKIEAIQQMLKDTGFKEYDAPSEAQMPLLIRIFEEWCHKLGLDTFLQPVGGAQPYLGDLIYIAVNTQALKGTARSLHLYPSLATDIDTLDLITYLSRLADLIAYVAKTPRDVVAHKTISQLIAQDIAFDEGRPPCARLVYHHVAENRGLLLNFIHNAVIDALTDEKRVPLLYAPSGVVYLEHRDAPGMASVETLAPQITALIRRSAGDRLLNTGKGAKRGNTFLQIDDSYNDFFSLPEMIASSMALISRYIRSNKTPARFEAMAANQWTGWDHLPENVSTASDDARVDQIAEWAGFVEAQFRDRFHKDTGTIVQWLLAALDVSDLTDDFLALKAEATKGGLRYWWHWAGAHALVRRGVMDDIAVQEWLHDLSQKLVAEMTEDLPEKAQVNRQVWIDLEDYVRRVVTLYGDESQFVTMQHELEHYINAKTRRGQDTCAICGSEYAIRKPSETAVAFQPGVFTQRLKLGASDNKRRLCTICALEQLLRQLFVDNLDVGSKAESQRIRYLSFYPSYFFSPETLRVVQRTYNRVKSVRISDSELWRALREQDDLTDPAFWQKLDAFLLYPAGEGDTGKFQRVLSYQNDAQSTYFTAGFRNIDPTETESWIVPSFLALVMAVCLDVKVVASDSGIPLMLEAAELPETLWFDGVHPAVEALIGDKRLDVDSVGLALARLTAAYLIHLDTNYKPPKENWQQFGPVAHALTESPLYVFHFLKQQTRDDKRLTPKKVRRYIGYAETLFNPQGDATLDYARELTQLYHRFYRVQRPFSASSYTLLRPIDIVANTLLDADPDLFPSEEALIGLVRGQLKDRLDSSETKAFVLHSKEAEADMLRFCEIFVRDIFIGIFRRDTAALRGKQLNLLRGACEVYYLDAARQSYKEHQAAADSAE